MKKIAINLIAINSEYSTGAFRYIKLMIMKMANYNLKDTQIYIYKQKHIKKTYLDFPDTLPIKYINVPTFKYNWQRILFEQTLFYFYIKKCDVFYSFCTSLPLLVRAKKIFTLHDVYYFMKGRYGKIQTAYLKLMTKIYASVADEILTVSEYSKNEIIEKLRVSPNKITITYNFVINNPTKNFSDIEIVDLNKNNIDLNVPFFLYIGNFQPGKNLKGLVQGFDLFRKKYNSRCQLILVGGTKYRGKEILNYLNSFKEIHCTGFLSRNDLEFLISKSIAITLVSFCEGFGIPPLEGFMYGKPALVSNVTSLHEVVGNAGVKVNPYDINDIAEGFQKIIINRNEYKKEIPNQLKKFDSDKIVKTFMNSLGIEYIN